VTILEVKYKADKEELKIKATSSEQPDAVLTVVGFGEMTWKNNKYEYKEKPVGPCPEEVTVMSSLGGSATAIVCGEPDEEVVTLKKVEYKEDKQELKVEVTCNRGGSAELTVEGYGPMTWKNGDKFKFQDKPVEDPGDMITVISDSGASYTAPVKHK
jgi:hypothetical protein